MTKTEFEKLFQETTNELIQQYIDPSHLSEVFAEISKNSNTIDQSAFTQALFIESLKYTNTVVYSVLSKVLDLKD